MHTSEKSIQDDPAVKAGDEVSVQKKDTIRAKLKEYRVTICLADQHCILFGIKLLLGLLIALLTK